MAVSERTHRFVRRLTGWYPFRIPAYGVNVFLSWIGFDGPTSQWMAAAPSGDVPGAYFDVSNRYHRKNFYFLKAYWRECLKTPLAQYLKQTLKPGGTYLDIGAHLGFYSFLASSLVGPSGAVHAFEPDPLTLTSVTKSAELNGRHVVVHGLALSDAPGELKLYRASAQAHSLVAATGNDPRFKGEATLVPVSTLDAWAAQHGVDGRKVQAIKVDVEGAEAQTLTGGREFAPPAAHPSGARSAAPRDPPARPTPSPP